MFSESVYIDKLEKDHVACELTPSDLRTRCTVSRQE